MSKNPDEIMLKGKDGRTQSMRAWAKEMAERIRDAALRAIARQHEELLPGCRIEPGVEPESEQCLCDEATGALCRARAAAWQREACGEQPN